MTSTEVPVGARGPNRPETEDQPQAITGPGAHAEILERKAAALIDRVRDLDPDGAIEALTAGDAVSILSTLRESYRPAWARVAVQLRAARLLSAVERVIVGHARRQGELMREIKEEEREPASTEPEPVRIPSDEATGTHLWFAHRLVADHGRDLRYVGAWRRWLAYDETSARWVEDETGEVWRRAHGVAGTILDEALTHLRDAIAASDRCAIERAEAAVRVARRFHDRPALEASIALASRLASVVATTDQWDRDAHLLSVGAGQVVDLRAGEARPAARGDSLRRGTDVMYDPEAPAPTWARFLERVLPVEDVRAFVRRLAGFWAVGAVREHIFPVFHGVGANGKTTYLEAIRHVLGEYACGAPTSLLLQSRGDRHPTELAILFRRRLVICSEAPEGGRLAEERVKAITGGDRIVCRRMREDFWEFEPSHHVVLATNHKPKIAGADEGIWRRTALVPWTETIPEAERDPTLPAKLQAEAPGILRWIVEGAIEYLRDGLCPPEAVRVATTEYRQGEDVLGEFLAENVIESADAFLAAKALHERYVEWAAEAGIPEPWGQRTLTAKIRDRGYQYARQGKSKVRGFTGRALKVDRSDRSPSVDCLSDSSRRHSTGEYRSERSTPPTDPADVPEAEGWFL